MSRAGRAAVEVWVSTGVLSGGGGSGGAGRERREARDGVGERAGGEEGAGRLGEEAAGDALAGADGDGGVDLRAGVGLGDVVVDVEADRTVGGEREAVALRLVARYPEADPPPGQGPVDARRGTRHQTRRVEVVDVERQRRPAGDRIRVR